jgi:hypothetical protein
MKKPTNKIFCSIFLVLLLTLSMMATTLYSASGAVVIRNPFTVFAYVSAVPNPVGVGQTALVTFRVDQP